jgi:hypothetical protein
MQLSLHDGGGLRVQRADLNTYRQAQKNWRYIRLILRGLLWGPDFRFPRPIKE